MPRSSERGLLYDTFLQLIKNKPFKPSFMYYSADLYAIIFKIPKLVIGKLEQDNKPYLSCY